MRTLVVLACALATGGCAVTFDTIYLIGGRTKTARVEESAPTERTTRRLEVSAARGTAGALELSCHQRERAIERRWDVVKTYRRRGGYDRKTYATTATIDVVVAGMITGIVLAACHADDSDLSCWNALYAAPFAVDLGYSLIRRSRAKDAVLVDKYKTGDDLRLAAEPVSEQATNCDTIESLWVGHAVGPSDEQTLAGLGDGRVRTLAEGAIGLELLTSPTPSTAISPEAATLWLESPRAKMWALDARGVPHAIETDRCALLRPHAYRASKDARERFDSACPGKQR